MRFNADMDDPLFGVVLQNDRRETVLAASNLWSNPQSGRFAAGREIEYRVALRQPARPGRYHATPAVAKPGRRHRWVDRRERMLSLLVSGQQRTDAVVDLPYEVEVAPGAPAREEVPS